jgi:hypothetical protein
MFPDDEIDLDAYIRALTLDHRRLNRFLLVACGHGDQWYWTRVLRTHEEAGEVTLMSQDYLFHFTQTLYGMQVFDDRGILVHSRTFDHPRHVINGDRFHLQVTFQRPEGFYDD